jgi:3-oxoacyl-[acyl-carrier-protein] synthase-3
MKTYAKVTGSGFYVPERVVTNEELSALVNTSDEWITERTGIKERRWFNPETDTVANMAAKASRIAIDQSGIRAEDIDCIVFATITPDYFFPGSGVLLQRELGLLNIPAIDLRNACSGFIYSLSVADQFIKTGMYKTILVVGGEIQSSAMDFSDEGRSMSVIFADGAGAMILQASDAPGILSTHLHSDGRFAEELCLKDPGSSRKVRLSEEIINNDEFKAYMNGREVFKTAVVKFPEVIREALAANNLQESDIDLLIPHQANLRISEFVRKSMDLDESKVFNNIMHYGNTTAASIPIAFKEAWSEGKISSGSLVCLAAFGSGYTWASALIRM